MRITSLTIFASAIALANCNGEPTDYNTGICSGPSIAYDNTIAPLPGATGVPTAPGQIILQEILPEAATLSLVPNTNGKSASPIPLGVLPTAEPGATASPGPPPPKIFNYPQLQSATLYYVAYATSGGVCPPEVFGNTSFTTQ